MKKILNEYMILDKEDSSSEGELHIEGTISDSKWWDDDVSPKAIADSLKEIGKVNKLNIYVNSYGGSCIAGNAIVDIIDDYKKKNNCPVNVHIRGIAASMGSGIAMVGDTVTMANNSLFMLHRPLTETYGNADDLEKAINLLNKTEHVLVKNYMRRFNGTEDELEELMRDETWLTAEEAKDLGFVDEITEGVKISASAKGIRVSDEEFEKKIADVMKKKYPQNKIEEEKNLNYDEKLKEFGIDEESFKSFNVESETLINIANKVKESVKPEPVNQFVDKASACETLNVKDITAEELLNYAKAGMNPPKPDKEIERKSKAYDKILVEAKDDALHDAVRAEGNMFNESIVKKMLEPLDYDDVKEISESWKKKAKEQLNAGRRQSVQDSQVSNSALDDYINPKDCIVG